VAKGQIFCHLLFAQKPFSSPPMNVESDLCCSRFSKAEVYNINAQRNHCLCVLALLVDYEVLRSFIFKTLR